MAIDSYSAQIIVESPKETIDIPPIPSIAVACPIIRKHQYIWELFMKTWKKTDRSFICKSKQDTFGIPNITISNKKGDHLVSITFWHFIPSYLINEYYIEYQKGERILNPDKFSKDCSGIEIMIMNQINERAILDILTIVQTTILSLSREIGKIETN